MRALPDIPPRLIRALKAGDCVVFLGSGVGCQAGLPDWDSIISLIKDRIIDISARNRKKTATLQFLKDADALSIVEYYKSISTVNEYSSFLVDHFNPTSSPSELHHLIAQLPCPFFITTNFDPLFEAAFYDVHHYLPMVCTRYSQVVVAKSGSNPFLIKFHGSIQDPDSIIFSQSDYDKFQTDQTGLLDFVRTYLDASVVLFVGYSLKDPDFDSLIGKSTVLTGGSRRDDFAVFRKLDEPRCTLLHRRGIQVLNVDSYEDIPRLFMLIAEECVAQPRQLLAVDGLLEENVILEFITHLNETIGSSLCAIPSTFPAIDNIHNDLFISRQVFLEQEIPQNGSHAQIPDLIYRLPEHQHKLLEQSRKILLTGEPGSGKSFLVQTLVQRAIEEDNNIVHVLIRLHEFSVSGDSLPNYIANKITAATGTNLAENKYNLIEAMSRFQFVIYADGLDEVDPRLRGHVTRELDDLVHRFESLSVIVTSRPSHESLPLNGYILVRLSHLSREESSMLIEKIATTVDSVTCSISAAEQVVTRYPYIGKNPLLVTCLMMTELSEDQGRLSATDITSNSIDTLINEGFKRERCEISSFGENIFRNILSHASFLLWINSHRVGADERSWLKAVAASIALLNVDVDPLHLINIAIDEMGILRRMADDRISFLIKSFYELLVAESIVQQKAEQSFSHEFTNDTAWENVIRFVCVLAPLEKRKSLLEKIWTSNQTLALRIISDRDDMINLLPQVLSIENEDEIISVFRSISLRLSESQVIECVEPLFMRSRRNGHILYFAVEILEALLETGNDGFAVESAKRILTGFWSEAKQHGAFPSLITIQNGMYEIGDDQGLDSDEKPRHPVLLDKYQIGATHVTNREYRAFVPSFKPGYGSEEDDMPATDLTWYEAMLYSRWICGKHGRLPTEAEWEVASRGPASDGRQYPWGDDCDISKANVERSAEKATAVHSYPANEFGLYDTTGNIFEWCFDWHAQTFYTRTPFNSPGGPKKGKHKVMRGGCWARGWDVARCSYRVRQIPATRDILVGFRVCVGVQPEIS